MFDLGVYWILIVDKKSIWLTGRVPAATYQLVDMPVSVRIQLLRQIFPVEKEQGVVIFLTSRWLLGQGYG